LKWRPRSTGRDNPANEARGGIKERKELTEGKRGRGLSERERRDPRGGRLLLRKPWGSLLEKERKNQQWNETTTEEELRARKERTSQVESMRQEEGWILTPGKLEKQSKTANRALSCDKRSNSGSILAPPFR
jgi:hypothetical protein